ncbi:MAG: type II toxin-antitoxin system VapC family toxin [Alphaproteobacteria bacterium]|jgi:PIN domain nuclease of toxin-antitoxin system|nr:type II toxin-antitoxin system VapC family toxin [Thalassospira sp.]MCE2965300.1 type II toxin-antitoxin system VapC family toxin [Alphaproteobacteria bacterium]
MQRGTLIDSSVLLWAMLNMPGFIGAKTRMILDDEHIKRYVSVATFWELTIKKSIGKLAFPDDLVEQTSRANITVLPIENSHLNKLILLPHFHRDPFDRLLIAQAQAENLTLLTTDKNIKLYAVDVLDAAA